MQSNSNQEIVKRFRAEFFFLKRNKFASGGNGWRNFFFIFYYINDLITTTTTTKNNNNKKQLQQIINRYILNFVISINDSSCVIATTTAFWLHGYKFPRKLYYYYY